MRAVAILTLGGSRKHVRIDPKTAVSWRTPDMLILQITLELVQSAPGGAHGDAGAGARGRVQACLTNAGQLKQKPSEGESLELSCRWRARVPLWRLPREPSRKKSQSRRVERAARGADQFTRCWIRRARRKRSSSAGAPPEAPTPPRP